MTSRKDDSGIPAARLSGIPETQSEQRMHPLEASVYDAPLPDGEYTIERRWNDAIVTATGAERQNDASPHPAFAMVATLAATGVGIEDLCRLCGSSVADGPMLGECRVVIHQPLKFDLQYVVKRRVLSLEHKKGRRLAAMDLLRFVAELHEPDSVKAAEVTYTWVMPKAVRK
jgi:hypothetical protein